MRSFWNALFFIKTKMKSSNSPSAFLEGATVTESVSGSASTVSAITLSASVSSAGCCPLRVHEKENRAHAIIKNKNRFIFIVFCKTRQK